MSGVRGIRKRLQGRGTGWRSWELVAERGEGVCCAVNLKRLPKLGT